MHALTHACTRTCTHTHTHTHTHTYSTYPDKELVFGWFNGLAYLLHVGAKEEGQARQDEQNETEQKHQSNITATTRESKEANTM